MRQLSNVESWLLLLGGLLMVVGAGANVLLAEWAPFVFAPGALLFAAIQLRQRYEGSNFAVRRLRRMMMFSDLMFVLAAALMLANRDNMFNIPWVYYVSYVHNNWIVVLLIAAILQLYSSHRIANELEKEAK